MAAMRRALATVGAGGLTLAAVAMADPGTGLKSRLELHASKPAASAVALRYNREFGLTLVHVDARTLRTRGRGLRLGPPCGDSGSYAFRGKRLALGGTFGRVCLVDSRSCDSAP